MIILGIDSSSISCSAAVYVDGEIKSEEFINNGLTHSQTLLPMVKKVLSDSKISTDELDLICVTEGPGSFTGLRIGIATVKGIAAVNNTKCLGVSSLEAIAQTASIYDGIICAVMDARCNQVYNAIFESKGGVLNRVCEDRAISIETLENELLKFNTTITLCGDGVDVCIKNFKSITPQIANEEYKLPKAGSVCLLGEKYNQEAVTPEKLTPVYLRLPQATRELIKKKEVSK